MIDLPPKHDPWHPDYNYEDDDYAGIDVAVSMFDGRFYVSHTAELPRRPGRAFTCLPTPYVTRREAYAACREFAEANGYRLRRDREAEAGDATANEAGENIARTNE